MYCRTKFYISIAGYENIPAVVIDICGICRYPLETNWLVFSVLNSFIRCNTFLKQSLLTATYMSSRIAFHDLIGVSKPSHSRVEVVYSKLICRRSTRSFSMTMSKWTFFNEPTCILYATILVGENVSKLECTKHRSLLTVRSLYSMSRRIRYGDVICYRTPFLMYLRWPRVEKESKSFGFVWPSVVCIRPDVIGMKSAIFTCFVVWGTALTARFFLSMANLNN
jgi:hypothetical protein